LRHSCERGRSDDAVARCSLLFGDEEEKGGDEQDSGGMVVGGFGDEDGDGFTTSNGDCDDGDASLNPAASEDCDGIDNDCDGEIDEDGTDLYYLDADGDGYGDFSAAQVGCDPGEGFSAGGATAMTPRRTSTPVPRRPATSATRTATAWRTTAPRP
jgi:hypothetical protein